MSSELKQTEIGRVPKEWEIVKVGDVAKVESGFGFPRRYQGKSSGKYPFIKVNDLNISPKYILSAENFIDDEDLKSLKAKVFPPNTVIFPKIGMATYLNKFRLLKVWGTFDNNVAGIIPKKIEPEFLFYYFSGKIDLKQLSGRTTAPSIRKTTLKIVKIPLPPLPEQRKIAEILSTVDRAIQRVDEAIARTERLKRGLMQELLTRGIGHEEFKDTEIGRIPKEWGAVKVGDIAEVKGGKRLPKGYSLLDSTTPHPYIRVVDFKNMSVDTKNLKYLSAETHEQIRRYTISSEDVYVSIAGTIGLAGTIPSELDDANLTENAAKLCNLKNVDNVFLAYALSSGIVRRQISALTGKATQPKLALYRIKKIKIPLPPLLEQRKIAEIFSTISKKLELEKKRKKKLGRIKRGLMSDLLTGKVRVKT